MYSTLRRLDLHVHVHVCTVSLQKMSNMVFLTTIHETTVRKHFKLDMNSSLMKNTV